MCSYIFWNQYNALGLGLTQLYNRLIVYNHKRHGIFKLGNKTFDFRRPARGFPMKLRLNSYWWIWSTTWLNWQRIKISLNLR